jgi:hypothetical protein
MIPVSAAAVKAAARLDGDSASDGAAFSPTATAGGGPGPLRGLGSRGFGGGGSSDRRKGGAAVEPVSAAAAAAGEHGDRLPPGPVPGVWRLWPGQRQTQSQGQGLEQRLALSCLGPSGTSRCKPGVNQV